MKGWLILVTEHAIVLIDAMSLAVIVMGTIEAIVGGVRLMVYGSSEHQKREFWLRYARWLVAGLTSSSRPTSSKRRFQRAGKCWEGSLLWR